MANPYLAKQTKARSPWGGQVGAVDLKRKQPSAAPELAPPARTASKEWLSEHGPTMCEVFKSQGKEMGSNLTFVGDILTAKSYFDVKYDRYVTGLVGQDVLGEDVRAFAWDCFVQGFQSVRGDFSKDGASDDGWGLGTWALVLGAVGATGLFGYNYLYAKG